MVTNRRNYGVPPRLKPSSACAIYTHFVCVVAADASTDASPPLPPETTHTHTHTHTHTRTRTRSDTHTHARARAHTRTHARTHTHTHTPTASAFHIIYFCFDQHHECLVDLQRLSVLCEVPTFNTYLT